MNTTLFPTWDTFFRQLLEQPQEIYLIGVWEALQAEYEMDINPASRCTRMVSVREQAARELAGMGSETLLAYCKQKRGDVDKNEDPLRAAGAASRRGRHCVVPPLNQPTNDIFRKNRKHLREPSDT